METLQVGELARRAGLSVRTLHHYDEIGLLSPSRRSAGGYRLYTAADVCRLTQIVSLRQLGLPLAEVRECLVEPGMSLHETLRLHASRLREQVEAQQRLLRRLEAIADRLARAEEASVEELTQTMEMIAMYEKHLTPEQLEKVRQRKEVVGQERIDEVQAEWPRLIAQVRAEMEKGTDPASAAVQQLARRWMSLVEEFTGGDAQLGHAVRTMYEEEPDLRAKTGLDPAIFEYVSKAVAAGKGAS